MPQLRTYLDRETRNRACSPPLPSGTCLRCGGDAEDLAEYIEKPSSTDDTQLESIAGGKTFAFYAKFFLACRSCDGEWAFASDTINDSDFVCPYCSSTDVRLTNAVQLPTNEWVVES